METRNIAISLDTAKEWYNKGGELKTIALQAFKESELVNKRVSSWKEFCLKRETETAFYVDPKSSIKGIVISKIPEYNANCYPTKEYAEAMKAFQKLLFLYHDWNCEKGGYSIIYNESNKCVLICPSTYHHVFNFASEKEAKKFKETFMDLLLEAAPLL